MARAVTKAPGKVRLVTLGGSGHEPGLSGFVGKGMLDYSVAGDIFAAPGAPRCMEAIRSACANGESALLIVLNHAGDVLSANIAMEMALREGLKIKMVLTHEDIAGGPNPDDRRGPGWFLPGLQGCRRRRRERRLARGMPGDCERAWNETCARWRSR